MDPNNKFVIFQRAFARKGLKSSAWLFERLPYPLTRVVTKILLSIAFCFVAKQKRIAQESIDIAFGDKLDPKEKKLIIKKCFNNVGSGMTEMLYFMAHPDKIFDFVDIEGKQYLDDSIKKGKGVIGLSAHYGNFPLMMMTFSRSGYKASAITRETRDKKLAEYLFGRMREQGLNPIFSMPRGECVSRSLKALRDNELLFIQIDQNFGGGGGVYVDFFGHKAATAPGPVILSLRTNAVILPMFIIRQGDTNKHKIIIEPPFEVEERNTEEETIAHNMGRITNLIEGYIRKYPHEWAWMHRRWKTRPNQEN